jgi:PBP1b-binding outer membrane lipoprotein LpoB
MKMTLSTLALALLCAGCTGETAPADQPTRAERDSMIGASALPGAGGVRRALEVADTAAARQSAIDSLLR